MYLNCSYYCCLLYKLQQRTSLHYPNTTGHDQQILSGSEIRLSFVFVPFLAYKGTILTLCVTLTIEMSTQAPSVYLYHRVYIVQLGQGYMYGTLLHDISIHPWAMCMCNT